MSEVEKPGLARILEQGGYDAGLTITPFSAATIAAEVVLTDLDTKLATAGRGGLLAAGDNDTAPSLVLFGTGALIDAFVLDVHRRRRVQLLEDPASGPLAPRIALFGPDAADRRWGLATLMGTELQLLDIDVFPVGLDQAVELDVDTVRHLQRYAPCCAANRLDTAATDRVPIRRNVLMAFDGPELPVVTALGFERPTALARAGLGIDLCSTLALVPAATALLRSGHPAAFGVWCEVARLRTNPALLADTLAEATADHGHTSAERRPPDLTC